MKKQIACVQFYLQDGQLIQVLKERKSYFVSFSLKRSLSRLWFVRCEKFWSNVAFSSPVCAFERKSSWKHTTFDAGRHWCQDFSLLWFLAKFTSFSFQHNQAIKPGYILAGFWFKKHCQNKTKHKDSWSKIHFLLSPWFVDDGKTVKHTGPFLLMGNATALRQAGSCFVTAFSLQLVLRSSAKQPTCALPSCFENWGKFFFRFFLWSCDNFFLLIKISALHILGFCFFVVLAGETFFPMLCLLTGGIGFVKWQLVTKVWKDAENLSRDKVHVKQRQVGGLYTSLQVLDVWLYCQVLRGLDPWVSLVFIWE